MSVPDCIPGEPSDEGSPASPGTHPFPVFLSVQGQVLKEEEDLPPRAVSVLLVLERKEMSVRCRAPALLDSLPRQAPTARSQDGTLMPSSKLGDKGQNSKDNCVGVFSHFPQLSL